jgi:hypothetical protein
MCLNSVLIRLTGPLDWRNARCTNFVGFPKEFSLCIPLVHRKVKGNKVWLKIYCAHNTIRCIGGERECDIVEVILRYFYRHCPRAACYGLLLEGLRSLELTPMERARWIREFTWFGPPECNNLLYCVVQTLS